MSESKIEISCIRKCHKVSQLHFISPGTPGSLWKTWWLDIDLVGIVCAPHYSCWVLKKSARWFWPRKYIWHVAHSFCWDTGRYDWTLWWCHWLWLIKNFTGSVGLPLLFTWCDGNKATDNTVTYQTSSSNSFCLLYSSIGLDFQLKKCYFF